MPDLTELVERVMTEHWDFGACPCTFCMTARELGCRPRGCYPTNPVVSILYDGAKEQKRPVYDWANPCKHERLNENVDRQGRTVGNSE